MAAPVVMEVSETDVQNILKHLDKDLARKAIRSALDRTATWAKNYMATDVSSNYNIMASRVKGATKTKRTTQTNLVASTKVSGKGLSMLDDFKAIQDAVGIKVNVSKMTTQSTPRAFINVVSGYKAPSSVTKRTTVRPPGVRPMQVEWKSKQKQIRKLLKRGAKWGRGGKAVIMMRVGQERYPTTGKPGRGPSIPMLANRTRNREKRNADMLNHLYQELETQIANRTKQISPVSELE